MSDQRKNWSVPRMWPGSTVAILAGGPSLTQSQVDTCRGRCRVIAINDAYKLAPWGDVHYFCDARWYEWHKGDPAWDEFEGIRVTLENYELAALGIRCLHNYQKEGLWLTPPDGVATGRNSGIQAINLAVHLGAARILLLGYDLGIRDGRSHWHGGHPVATAESVYRDAMLPMFPAVKRVLDDLGIECINCTPGSSLKVFPRAEIADCLQRAA